MRVRSKLESGKKVDPNLASGGNRCSGYLRTHPGSGKPVHSTLSPDRTHPDLSPLLGLLFSASVATFSSSISCPGRGQELKLCTQRHVKVLSQPVYTV